MSLPSSLSLLSLIVPLSSPQAEAEKQKLVYQMDGMATERDKATQAKRALEEEKKRIEDELQEAKLYVVQSLI